MTSPRAQRYRFGGFDVVASERLLCSRQGTLRISRKAVELLLVLLERRGQVVDKDELMRRVWPDVVVEENSLNQCISALRRALGDSATVPRFVETVARRGYRFLAEVEVVGGPGAEKPGPLRSSEDGRGEEPGPGRSNKVAVLPFRVAAGGEDEYLAEGLTDALIARLSRSGEIEVRSSGAVRRYATGERDALHAGADLAVDCVLDGTIRRSGDRIRVSAELIRVQDGTALWAEQMDERADDLFALEDRLAERILAAFGTRLGLAPERPTTDAQAYQLYLMGRHFSNRLTGESFRAGLECFERATALDPGYALAHAGLAYHYLQSVDLHLPPHEAMPRARQAAERALQLDPRNAEAHGCLAGVLYWYDWDWPAAEKEHQRAVALAPDEAAVERLYGWCQVLHGEAEEGVARVERGAELDPWSIESHVYLCASQYFARRFGQACERGRETLRLYPDLWVVHALLARCHTALGEPSKAAEEAEAAHLLEPGSTEALADLGYCFARTGRVERARGVLEEFQQMARTRHVPPFNVALVHLGLDQWDAGFECLEAAVEQRSWYASWLETAPMLDLVRGDPRFQRLRARVGI